MPRYLAGIDSGTQSTKVLIVTDEGRVVGGGQAPHALIEGLPLGHKEQHPREWIAALKEAFRAATADAGIDPLHIAAVGVSGQQHGLVALDKKGEVIRPAKLWCDTSTAAECAELMDAVGGRDAYRELIGNGLPSGYTASKLLWLRKNEPANFERLATVLLPHDYLNFWLTGGGRAMEWGDASGSGLMDVRTRTWRGEVVASIHPKLMTAMPELRPSWEPAGTIGEEAAVALGLSRKCVVAAGGGDNMMAAIGTGNVAPGVVTVSLGTSGTIFAYSAEPIIDPEGEIAAFCDSTGRWLPLLCTMNVTVATEMVRALFGLDVNELNDAAAHVRPGADGLMLLPYFEGERTPDVPDGTGVWFGSNHRTATPGHFARAAMEGATLGLNYGFGRLKQLGIEPTEIRLTGGGAKSALWRQVCADVFNAPVVACVEPEGAAYGAAMQARWILERPGNPAGAMADLARAWVALDESSRCFPQPDNVALYEKAQELHDRLSLSLRALFHAHRGVRAMASSERVRLP